MSQENKTYLEIDDNECHYHSGEEVAEVWRVLPVDSLLDTIKLVWLSQKEMEQSDDGSLELSSLVGSNGHWRE